MKKHRYKKRFAVFILLCAFVIVLGITTIIKAFSDEPAVVEKPEAGSSNVELQIAVAGNLVMHNANNEAAYDNKTKTYNYDKPFQYIKKYIEKADISMCDLETTFVGSPYSGYPLFKSPASLAETLEDVGFDVVSTSSNHAYDSGDTGIIKTINVLKKNNLAVAGTKSEASDKNYTMVESKGLKVAIVSYVYAGNGYGARDLNGNVLTSYGAARINTFTTDTFNSDIKKIKKTTEAARNDGANIVLMHYHWGDEYSTKANDIQKSIAQKTANLADVDMIVGTHPHVPQSKETLVKEGTDKKIPVYYALGNLYSNQRRELIENNRYVEEGYLSVFNVEYNKKDKEIKAINQKEIPYWVDKYKSKGKTNYSIIPLVKGFEKNKTLKLSGHEKQAKAALEDLNGILGND